MSLHQLITHAQGHKARAKPCPKGKNQSEERPCPKLMDKSQDCKKACPLPVSPQLPKECLIEEPNVNLDKLSPGLNLRKNVLWMMCPGMVIQRVFP